MENQIKVLREKAARALKSAQDIRDRHAGKTDWPSEDQANFDKFMKDFGDAHSEAQKLQTKKEQLDELDRQSETYFKPQAGPQMHATSQGPKSEAQKRKERETFTRWIRQGEQALSPEERHALLGTQDDLGGYLVPEDFRAEVIKDLAGFAVMRSVCRVEATGRDTLVYPSIQPATTDADIYSTGYTGAWRPQGYVTGGTAPTVQNQPTFGQERVPVHCWQPNAIEVTRELLEDSAANLDGILAEVIAETRALDEDAAFLTGNGVGRPLGILDPGSGITQVNSGSAAAVTYGGLIDLQSNLPAQYRQNARLIMSSRTYGSILKLNDPAGNPIIPPNTMPGTFWGKPILFSEFLAEIAANSLSIIFGDFRYYIIAERRDLSIQRLVERYAPNVGILPTARVGGQVLRKAAFRIQKIAA